MRAAPDAELPAQRLARLLLTGPLGTELYAALWRDFPGIDRDSVFFAISLAWTDHAAQLVAAEAEVAALRQQLAPQARRAA